MDLLDQCLPTSLPSKEKGETDAFMKRVSRGIQRVSNGLSSFKAGALIQVNLAESRHRSWRTIKAVWMPDTSCDGRVLLQTEGLPFSISGVGDLLALFRCISCKYRFDSNPMHGEWMGAIGRVFHYGQPEMCLDVQQYDKNTYLRIKEAKACRIHSTLIMPVFITEDRQCPVAVVEISHHDKAVQFKNIVQLFRESLSIEGLYTADMHVDSWKLGLRHWPVEVFSVPSRNHNFVDASHQQQRHPQEQGIPKQHCLAKAMQTGFGDVSDFLMNVGMDSLNLDGTNFSCVDMKEGYSDSLLETTSQLTYPKTADGCMSRSILAHSQSDRGSSNNNNEALVSLHSAHEEKTQHGGCQAQAAAQLMSPKAVNTDKTLDHNKQTDTIMADNEETAKCDNDEKRSTESSEIDKSEIQMAKALTMSCSSPLSDGIKKNENRLGGGAGKRLGYKDLEEHFGHGLKDAANRLGICPTTLKRACRRNGISRWPSRQISKLSKVWKQMGYKGTPPPWLLQNAISGNLRSDNLAYVLNAGLHVGLQQSPHPTTRPNNNLFMHQAQLQGVHTDSYEAAIVKNKTHHGAFTAALQGNESFVFDESSIEQRACNNTWHGGQTLESILRPSMYVTEQSLDPYICSRSPSFDDCSNNDNSCTKQSSGNLRNVSPEDLAVRFHPSHVSDLAASGLNVQKGTTTLCFEMDKRERLETTMVPVLSEFAMVDHQDDEMMHEQFGSTGAISFDPTHHIFQ